jgi:spore maturation protein CgeB
MELLLEEIVRDGAFAASVAARGRETVLARHTCGHRADELVRIVEELRA